ncbi:hypothetical protein ACHAXR_008498 [Thalassiosira sp. AJA248-18]
MPPSDQSKPQKQKRGPSRGGRAGTTASKNSDDRGGSSNSNSSGRGGNNDASPVAAVMEANNAADDGIKQNDGKKNGDANNNSNNRRPARDNKNNSRTGSATNNNNQDKKSKASGGAGRGASSSSMGRGGARSNSNNRNHNRNPNRQNNTATEGGRSRNTNEVNDPTTKNGNRHHHRAAAASAAAGGAKKKSNRTNSRNGQQMTKEEENEVGSSRNNNGRSNNNNNNTRKNNKNNNDNRSRQQQQRNNSNKNNKSRTKKVQYEPHATYSHCIKQYTTTNDDNTATATTTTTIIRGKLRVMPSKNGAAFVTCDRGSLLRDVVIKDEKDRNRALDGDYVFVELYPFLSGEDDDAGGGACCGTGGNGNNKKFVKKKKDDVTIADFMTHLELNGDNRTKTTGNDERKEGGAGETMVADEGGEVGDEIIDDVEYEEEEYLIETEDVVNDGSADEESKESLDDNDGVDNDNDEEEVEMWHDDEVQMSLWDPVVNLRKRSKKSSNQENVNSSFGTQQQQQRTGKIIYILPPKSSAGQQPSEFNPEDESYRSTQNIPKRTIVGTLTQLPSYGGGGDKGGGRYVLVPNNKSLPRFMCPLGTKEDKSNNRGDRDDDGDYDGGANAKTLYRAEYTHGSWHATNRWPPCTNITRLCGSCNVDDETKALLVENGVDHGEFTPAVLRDVEQSVKSGRFFEEQDEGRLDGDEMMGWKPTEAMCRGRRDYRNHRVFTIDPTTAKDLDDALHITPLSDGRVEIGVHIADVSHFIQPNSAVDEEALKRATTVYLVNGIVPMLPRPLCEIACSLNENVERLAFSCVWRMNMDGSLSKRGGGGGMTGKPKKDDIWYGRTVIKSCARLDYATAQNIIDGKVATGESRVDETLWPKSRQPTGGHTIDDVASDVRLMHKVAMARRKLRFDNGALALNGVKLAFQLEEDGTTPKLCAPYPIRDSNRLIEEFMLLANYLVAQRLITHAHGRALLRNHSPPIDQGMQQVVDVSKESFNFDIDTTNSSTLQESLSRLTLECDDELVVQCVTESLMTPMRPAEYMAAGELDEVDWQHFALNIPYYTHFTSPIRRYPDVIVHRLLQATLDDDIDDFPLKQKEIHAAAGHCNDMRMSAKKAQDRSDRVFLSLYLKKNPISSVLGVCLGVGEKTFTVFVPSLGMSTRVFLQEHEDEFNINAFEDSTGKRRIVISLKTNTVPGMQPGADTSSEPSWKSLDICVFTKLEVACTCKTHPPIDVRVKVVVFLQEHEDEFNINAFEDSIGKRRIVISPKTNTVPGMQPGADTSSELSWKSLDIRVFTKLEVACTCKIHPPIDVRVKVAGPWTG